MRKAWTHVALGDVVIPISRAETPMPGQRYRQLGVKLWGEGVYEREPIDGIQTKYPRLFRSETGDLVVNKIWARNGSVGVVNESIAGSYGSSEFPMFSLHPEKISVGWMHWLTKTPGFWKQCDEKSQGSSGKNRIRPEKFLEIEVPLPPLAEQCRIVKRIEEVAKQVAQYLSLRVNQEGDLSKLLLAEFLRITREVPRHPFVQVAPLVRRPVLIDALESYPELGIRSFGKGTFHKPALTGLEIGNKRVFRIEPGDLLFSNVFAWEGAIAVAKREDNGRVGSHRYITCVPVSDVATAQFLKFYFLTEEGLNQIGAASPGGAGRNRTLGLAALENIPVPVPQIEVQLKFDALQAEVDALKHLQTESSAKLNALLPAILDRAFKGAL